MHGSGRRHRFTARASVRQAAAAGSAGLAIDAWRNRPIASIRLLHPRVSATKARVCLFDFDGTLSLIRSGWMDVMIPIMVEILLDLKTGEAEDELRGLAEDWVWRLTGEQTVFQMIELANQIELRGGRPLAPLVYKSMYLDRLHQRIRGRLEALRIASEPPDQYLVPGARASLETLEEKGLIMYLASGTDQELTRTEARLLDIERYFDGRVYGALDDYKSFSKKILIRNLIDSDGVRGQDFLGFGDGCVETENIKEVGGVAVGVATNEPDWVVADEWKIGVWRLPAPTSSSRTTWGSKISSRFCFHNDKQIRAFRPFPASCETA